MSLNQNEIAHIIWEHTASPLLVAGIHIDDRCAESFNRICQFVLCALHTHLIAYDSKQQLEQLSLFHTGDAKFLARDVSVRLSVRLSVCDVCALWSQGAMDPGYLCMLG